MAFLRSTWAISIVSGLVAGFMACRTASPKNDSSNVATSGSGVSSDLAKYEAARILDLKPKLMFGDFVAAQGWRNIERDSSGQAKAATIRVLSDNPGNQIQIVGEFNNWQARESDAFKAVEGVPQMLEARIVGLKHGHAYRLVLNGKMVIDPAAVAFTDASQGHFNSMFWDFGRPNAYRLQKGVVDIRSNPVLIGESEVYELSRNFKHRGNGRQGPNGKANTYRFIAESGLVDELKQIGYNAFEFVPFNTSVDGDVWKYRYQVFGLFAPDPRYGTPEEFAMMTDAFNKAGIAVIMDAVIGHFPFQCEAGGPCNIDVGAIGLHKWKKADGRQLYGQNLSPWGTYRYDYENPFIRRFLTDSILTMMYRYGITGVRFDNYDGIRFEAGGTGFLKQLATEVREYRPEAILIAEMFFGEASVLHRLKCPVEGGGDSEEHPERQCLRDQFGNAKVANDSGYGINFRTHSNFFDFIKDNMVQFDDGNVNMDTLVHAIRDPWGWGEAARVQYITNHDEAANRRDGATGSYVASLILGEGGNDFGGKPEVGAEPWKFVQQKTKAYASLAMLSSTAYLDMPQVRLQQRGTFYTNPGVDWAQAGVREEQGKTYLYFRDLSNMFKDTSAFAFRNLHENVENHYDPANKVVSLYRRDRGIGEDWYALVNLTQKTYWETPYEIGVHQGGEYRVVIDSDDKKYVGSAATTFATGALEDKIGGNGMKIKANCDSGLHGKPCRLGIPYIGPYATIVVRHLH